VPLRPETVGLVASVPNSTLGRECHRRRGGTGSGTSSHEHILSARTAERLSKCLVLESFTDSDALLQHLANIGPSLPDLFAVAELTRFEVLGTPSDEAREALDGLNASYYPHLTGFQR
jgi:hypothetical protein